MTKGCFFFWSKQNKKKSDWKGCGEKGSRILFSSQFVKQRATEKEGATVRETAASSHGVNTNESELKSVDDPHRKKKSPLSLYPSSSSSIGTASQNKKKVRIPSYSNLLFRWRRKKESSSKIKMRNMQDKAWQRLQKEKKMSVSYKHMASSSLFFLFLETFRNAHF